MDLPDDLDDGAWPNISQRARIGLYSSASATFYAPSELAGPRGMHREIIRSTSAWYGQFPRYDTVFVVTDSEAWGMMRYRVARVRQFLSFIHYDINYPCALVEWFVTDADGPDTTTGMWIEIGRAHV